MQHDYSQKRKKRPFDLTPGVKGKSKGKLFASMLLYASFPSIWYATWPNSEKVELKHAYVTPWAGPFYAPVHYLNKLGKGLLGDATYQISRL